LVTRDSVAVVVVVRRHPDRLTSILESLNDHVERTQIAVANLSGESISVPSGVEKLELGPETTLSSAVTQTLAVRPGDVVWVLRDDTLPRSGALAALTAVFDTSPSVGVVGPKQLDADIPAEIREMGESISRSGFAVQLAEREMDQGQYDRQSDVLGVGEAGMLVRRSVWDELAGFDPALPFVDGALDFCYRARAAGWRVEIVPSAVIETGDSSLESVLGDVSDARVVREEAKARAHRVLAYISAMAAPFRGLTLLIGSGARGAARFIRKQPHPFSEFSGTVSGVLRTVAIAESRRSIIRTTTQPIDRARLFVTRTEMARRQALERDARRAAREATDTEPRLGFGQLGAWMTGAATLVGLILGYRYLGAAALSGGGLLPLSGSIVDVWSAVGATWTPIAGGFDSAPDGFGVLVAALASTTWWNPNLALVLLWLTAIPLSFVAGWVGAGAVTIRSSTAFIVATAWTLLPSLHSALAEGRLGAVLAHIAIPFAVRALSSRGTVSAGWFALLAAMIWVSVPALAPVILIATVVRAIAGRSAVLLALVPAIALEWPRILEAVSTNPVLYFGDRGVPTAGVAVSGDQIPLWPVSSSIPFLDPAVSSIVVYTLIALAAVATVAAIALGAARLGVITAVSATGLVIATVLGELPLTHISDVSVGVAPGPLLDPLWFALIAGLAIVSTSVSVVRGFAVPTVLAAFTVVSVTTIALPFTGGTLVQPSAVRSVPAYVEAETRTHPFAGTLVITPRDDSIVAELQRGSGATLTEWTASAAARREVSESEVAVATLAGNLIVESGFDVVPAAEKLNVRFVLLKAPPTNPAVSAIASHGGLTQVGQTTNGVLWIVDGETDSAVGHPSRDVLYVIFAALAVLVAIIAAIPTSLPRRRIGEDELVLETGENDG
jgi:GT2 family glycosyltransferase